MGQYTCLLISLTACELIFFGSITPWVTNMGLQNAFILAAFAGLAQVLTFLIFVKHGRTLKRRSVGRYKRYVKEMAQAGLVH